MLIAVIEEGSSFPRIGTVTNIPPNAAMETPFIVHWMLQERAPHKPKWLRFFTPSTRKDSSGPVSFSDVVLYDFLKLHCFVYFIALHSGVLSYHHGFS